LNDALKDEEQLSPNGTNHYEGLSEAREGDCSIGSPSLQYNCHGYAFDADGKSKYKTMIDDADDGAGVILDEDNGVYSMVIVSPGCVDEDIMYMGYHMNFVSEAETSECYYVLELKFKWACGPTYTFCYHNDGRDPYADFDGWSVVYYE
jgi:hypothetical protein